MQNNSYNSYEIINLRNSDREVILKIEKFQISKLNQIIIDFLNTNYKQYGFIYGKENKNMEIGNLLINTEYISKFVNNITIFGKIAERHKLKTVQEFTYYIKNNLSRLYDVDGDDFPDNYDIAKNTAKKGKRGENACKKNFEKMLYKKYEKEYKIESPDDTLEDIDGVDGKFNFGKTLVKLQIKPYTNYIKKDGKIFVYSKGSMCFNTHYLLLYKESRVYGKYRYDFITLINNKTHDSITYDKGVYVTDIENIVDPTLF